MMKGRDALEFRGAPQEAERSSGERRSGLVREWTCRRRRGLWKEPRGGDYREEQSVSGTGGLREYRVRFVEATV